MSVYNDSCIKVNLPRRVSYALKRCLQRRHVYGIPFFPANLHARNQRVFAMIVKIYLNRYESHYSFFAAKIYR